MAVMHVVLTLGGLKIAGPNDHLDTALRGWSTADGRRRRVVPYPQAANAESIRAGADLFDELLREELAAGNRVTGMGASQGAEALSLWLEQNAHLPSAPLRGQLDFVLIGNPCRRAGGVATAGNWLTKRGFLGKRRPTPETQYDVLDVATEDDMWANADGWPTGQRPKLNLLDVLLRRDPHVDGYDPVDLDACELRERSGNTRYLLYRNR